VLVYRGELRDAGGVTLFVVAMPLRTALAADWLSRLNAGEAVLQGSSSIETMLTLHIRQYHGINNFVNDGRII
jgi:hypothetical protein